MVSLKHFQNKAHSNMCIKLKRDWGVCEHHGMVLLCGLVHGQTFSLKWLTLAFVKRWCVCGPSSLLFHSLITMDDLLKATFLLCMLPYLIPHACIIDRPFYAIGLTKEMSFCSCVYKWMCVCLGGCRPGQKWLIILTNIWIFTSSTPQVFFKHFQTMSSICQFLVFSITLFSIMSYTKINIRIPLL